MNFFIDNTAEFLKNYPPFNFLNEAELIEITKSVQIMNFEKGKILFQIDEPLHDYFYMVASGVIKLTIISDAEESILNKCYIGDVFGLRPFFAKNNYMMTAKARDESLIYAIPIAVFRPFVAQNTEVLNFLLQSFAMNSANPSDNAKTGSFISDNAAYSDKKSEIQFFQPLTYNKKPLIASPNEMVREVAQIMTDNLTNSVLVNNNNKPIGIVTDTDLRTKIATGKFGITDSIDKIMSFPVITVPQNISLPEAQLLMLKNNVTHLCVTLDGTEKSDIRGIISEHDLIVAQSNNPGVLMKEIKKALKISELQLIRKKLTELIQNSISKNIPLPHVFNISGEITSALIKRCIQLAILELGSPPTRFSWFSIGSQGRKEQLIQSDQDSFLVFEDVPEESYRDVRDYYVRLSKRVIASLEYIGYAPCVNGNLSSDLHWCKSLSEWTKQFTTWIVTPGMKSESNCSIFFDYDLIFGDTTIEDALTETIYYNLQNNILFYDYLGNDTLRKPPPFNFFKKFILEEDDLHLNKFDIKSRALLSLIDGARLMVLSQGIKGFKNTYTRFKQLAMLDARYAEIYNNCAEAFITLYRIRTTEGLKNDDSGQYINLQELSKLDKEKLRNAFGVIKDMEDMIKERFKLTKFS